MKGIMFTARGKAEIIDEKMPECTDGTVLLRTIFSGLSNGTERSFLTGGSYGGENWPHRIGYQHVSEVVQCGSNIKNLSVGDVVVTAINPGHVQYYLARETDLLVKLPVGFDQPSAALMGVASVSYHDCRRAAITPEDKVIVIGGGLIGQFAAQAARCRGAYVCIGDRNADRLTLAEQLGADETVNLKDESGWERLEELKPFSVIMECSGADILDRIIGKPGKHAGLIARRSHARLVMVAGRFDVSYNFNAAGMAELDILHTQHCDQCDLEQVVRLVGRGDMQVRPLISEIVPFDDAVRIYDTLRDEKRKLLGIVFDYRNCK